MSSSDPFRSADGNPAEFHSPGFIRRYRLILHRTADSALLAVVRAVQDLTRFAEAEAMARMWDVQNLGRAVVLTTYFERAEFLVERFAERGLNATLEPA
jgi:ATP-dependent Clp protease adaptor protein ClpS